MGNFNLLPLDIMLEILSRVPCGNLLQHPSFPQMHLNHLNDSAHDSGKLGFIFHTRGSNTELVYYTEYTEYNEHFNRFTKTTRINLRPPLEDSFILGSCNGLICFNERLDNYYLQPVSIYNLITREYIFLPNIEGANIASGFGYTPSTNEYKVVRICKSSRGNLSNGIIQVYTLGRGIGWRNLGKMDYGVGFWDLRGVFFKGAIHWVDREGIILSFHLIDEEFRQLPSPPCLLPLFELHVLGDFLCAYKSSHYFGLGGYDIWVLKKNNHDVIWSNEFINIDGEPITITKNGGLLCQHNYNVYRYTPKASSSRMLVSFVNMFTGGVPHKNTLVSLKALGEKNTKLMDSGEKTRCSRRDRR